MTSAFEFTDVFLETRMLAGGECPCEEAFADVLDGLLGRMAHVFSVEAVVTEFVHHDLVCREIVGTLVRVHAKLFRASVQEIVDAQQEGSLADLVAVCSVLEMADRADCKDDMLAFA